MRISTNEALEKLEKTKEPFLELFKHGSLVAEIYKPDKVDLQKPHSRDEIYIVISGSGKFLNGEKTTEFKAGDFLFVKAGIEHRFLNFSDDFSTWVFFYGPEGGER